MKRKTRAIFLAVLVLIICSISPAASDSELSPVKVQPSYVAFSSPSTGQFGVMRPDRETRQQWHELSLSGPKAYIDPAIRSKRGEVSLLSHLQYTPSQRDQGSCGDCWAWAGTACLAIALSQQVGVTDRLSVQFLNSCYGTGSSYACCGGWAEYVANFYNSKGYCIPWSNTNASWQDGSQTCDMSSSSVACGSISTSPSYTINSCSVSYITTHEVSQATAIANIKNVLNQGKAIWFVFWAPTYAANQAFRIFWHDNTEDQYLPNFLDGEGCGQTWSDVYGFGHAVLCYGYNDDDPNNSVWYMLNSWGASSNRHNGTFLVDMDIGYNCQYDFYGDYYYNYDWVVFDVDFSLPIPTPSPTPIPFQPERRLILDSGDYNGDGTSDVAIFREAEGLWGIKGVTRFYFGSVLDKPVSGDYNGDGTAEVGIFRRASGLWAVRDVTRVYYGSASDIPIPGDYDGNGSCDVGIFRGSSGLWAVSSVTRVYFGGSSDTVVPGDYNGDGNKDIALFRSSSGLWALRNISRIYFGGSSDTVVPGDYNGDGTWEAGVFRSSSGMWAVRGVTRAYFGGSSDQPVPADFNGNSADDIGIFRDTSGLWGIRNISRVYFGSSGDIPVTR